MSGAPQTQLQSVKGSVKNLGVVSPMSTLTFQELGSFA
ncbi:hypothetical protein SAMN05446934_9929 [Paraburkholderia hospita]|nr:hypothetical protein SAMN05446934_9929 [Paraburkholderia hospita]